MSKILNLKSKSLAELNSVINDLTLKESIEIVKLPIMEADGNFVSVVKAGDGFNSNQINKIVTVDEENPNEEKKLEKKKQLKDLVIDKIKTSLEVSDELQALLNAIDKLNKETNDKDWTLNKEENTADLRNKNMKIFKQNEKLCLSHDGKVEIFNSVEELHNWLNKYNIPLPKNIAIHESTELLTELKDYFNKPELDYSALGKWQDIIAEKERPTEMDLELANKDPDQLNTRHMPLKTMTKALSNKYFNTHPEDDPTKGVRVINNLFPEEECTTTANLGAPMQYTADKKLNEDLEIIDENIEALEEESKASWRAANEATDIIRALNGDENSLSKLLIRYITRSDENAVKNLNVYSEDLVPLIDNYKKAVASRDPDAQKDAFVALRGGILEKGKDTALNDLAGLMDSYKSMNGIEKADFVSRLGFKNDENKLVHFLDANPDLNELKTKEKDLTDTNLDKDIRNQGNNTFWRTVVSTIKQLDPSYAGRAMNVGDIRAYKTRNPQIVEKALNMVTSEAHTANPQIPVYTGGDLKDYLTQQGTKKTVAYDLFSWALFNKSKYKGLRTNNAAAPTTANLAPVQSREQKIASGIKQTIEVDREAIQNELAQNDKARQAVRYAFADLAEEPNKDEIVNAILSSPRYSNLVKKGLLLRVIDNNIPLSAETLLNYANKLNVNVGNDYKLLDNSTINSILAKYNQSGLVNNIKAALNMGLTTPEKALEVVQGQEKDVQKAVASSMLQDPSIDTSTTKDAWEALLESIKNKPFKEKLKALKEAVLKEDETPEDFSSGVDSMMDTSNATSNKIDGDDLDDTTDPTADIPDTQSAPGFGDININANGFDPDEYGPDAADDDNLEGLPVPTEEFRVLDVLVNKADKNDVKVKLQNVQTGEEVIKSLAEIDI